MCINNVSCTVSLTLKIPKRQSALIEQTERNNSTAKLSSDAGWQNIVSLMDVTLVPWVGNRDITLWLQSGVSLRKPINFEYYKTSQRQINAICGFCIA